MSSYQKWLNYFSQVIKKQSFYSEKIEECMKNFAFDTLMKNESLQEAFGIQADDMELLYKQAYDLYEEDNFQEAEELFRLLVILNPFAEKYWMGLGASLQLLERHSEALKSYAIVAYLNESSPYPHFYAYECYGALDQKEDAKKALLLAHKRSKEHIRFRELYNKIEALQCP